MWEQKQKQTTASQTRCSNCGENRNFCLQLAIALFITSSMNFIITLYLVAWSIV